mmetsp:Transcript_5214/g.11310  ORF Transcript_5214/g.11310 Transcript_5214/m.11310 type:complete len:137 (+) Transcript_5214:42-452(+)
MFKTVTSSGGAKISLLPIHPNPHPNASIAVAKRDPFQQQPPKQWSQHNPITAAPCNLLAQSSCGFEIDPWQEEWGEAKTPIITRHTQRTHSSCFVSTNVLPYESASDCIKRNRRLQQSYLSLQRLCVSKLQLQCHY